MGIGECAPLPYLGCDDLPHYRQLLSAACLRFEQTGRLDTEALRPYPSILFGLETAIRHYEKNSYALWDTPFSRGEAGIPINGLIWMGNYRMMLEQIEAKMKAGFGCIKLKIGAIHFEEELALLRHIRNHFTAADITLRVDANGAFSPADALDKLCRLAELDLHSIEQPIRAGQWEEMARLTAATPLPIALDEELIGCNTPAGKKELLTAIRPQYIILKPSLHGGICGGNEWIEEAERQQIGWWITSALESNIGLNAIAHWCATFRNPLPQGLGTGGLFTNNVEMPLSIRKDCLWYEPERATCIGIQSDLHRFLDEWASPNPCLTVQTSGSTGTPKQLTVRKEQMWQSARLTCQFLGLQQGDNALLCMPLQYIAGKMMVVRSLYAGLNLIMRQPSGHPLADVTEPLRFAAMIPLQVYNTLQVPEERERLCRVEILIIGGGAIDAALEEEIRQLPGVIYSTYGMTETLSHIALRRLNGPQASPRYQPFPSVQLSLSADDTLVVNAPLVCDEPLVTNDVARLFEDGSFIILGRKDNIINSGGIKIQIECVEHALRSIFSVNFAVTSIPDPKFGEILVLLVAGEEATSLSSVIHHMLPAYQRPKAIFRVDSIPLTGSGKTDRTACRELAISNIIKNAIHL